MTEDGRYAMAYSHLDRGNSILTFLDADGKIHWEVDLEDSVWSVDACSTTSGARFVIGTGDSYIYLIDIGAKRKSFRRLCPMQIIAHS